MSGEITICSENLAHTCFEILELSFARNSGEEVVAACSDDLGILWISLVLSQTYSGHANMELVLPSVVVDAPQIV